MGGNLILYTFHRGRDGLVRRCRSAPVLDAAAGPLLGQEPPCRLGSLLSPSLSVARGAWLEPRQAPQGRLSERSPQGVSVKGVRGKKI
jgi:hypothetical protein